MKHTSFVILIISIFASQAKAQLNIIHKEKAFLFYQTPTIKKLPFTFKGNAESLNWFTSNQNTNALFSIKIDSSSSNTLYGAFEFSKNIDDIKKNRVAIFIGCMSNYTYTNTGDSLVKILKKLELDIFIPKKQLCCGAPAYFTGAFDTVDYLTKKNIEYFESWIDSVDAVIIPEATCSAMINKDWEHYLHDQPEWKERAIKLSNKIFLATKWLENNTKLKELLAKSGKKFDQMVTYHDPCHAKKMQNVWKEPRELLKQNYVLKEMSDSNRCCGFGGVTMQTEKYEFSKAAGAPKAAMIRDSKAQIVSAECSACRMQITNSLYLADVDVVFKNPIELIAEALED